MREVLPAPARRPLQSVLGVWSGAAVGVGVAIGAGIFRTPGYVASFLVEPWMVLAVWLLGGLLVIGDSLVLSELASRFPKAGGWFVYIERGWGRFPAFVYGWAFIVLVDPASSAALVVILGEYLSTLLGWTPPQGRLAGIGLTLGLFGLSLLGVRVGARTQQFLTWMKLAALVGVAALAFTLPAGSGAVEGAVPMSGGDGGHGAGAGLASGAGLLAGVLAIGLALQGVLWTFEGYANTTTMTEEAKDPRKTLPRALIGGTVALTVAYLAVNAAYLHVLGRDTLAASQLPGRDIVGQLFGQAGGAVFLVIALLAAVGSLNGAVLSAPRVAYALGRSGLAPEPLTRVSKVGTPDIATLWFAFAWTVFAWFGTFEELIAVCIFIGALANVAVTAALFRIRGWGKGTTAAGGGPAPGPAAEAPRHFRCPGYPWLPLLLLILWGALAAASLKAQGWKVGYGLLLVAVAGPVYWVLRMRKPGSPA
jgi:APA family basic amino acid/polyamine antiporter